MHLFSTLPGELISIFKGFGKSAEKTNSKVYLIGAYPRSIVIGEDSSYIEISVVGSLNNYVDHFIENYPMIKDKTLLKEDNFILIHSPYNKGDYIRIGKARLTEKGGAGVIKTEIFSRGFSIDALAVELTTKNFGKIIDYSGAMDDIKSGVLRAFNKDIFKNTKYLIKALVYKEKYKLSFDPITKLSFEKAIKKHKEFKISEIKKELEFIDCEKTKKSIISKIKNT